MQTHRIAYGDTRTYVLVMDVGDDTLPELQQFAREQAIDGAHFTAIGAFSQATLGWFDLERQDYRSNEVTDQCEVVSLSGDITRADPSSEERKVHAHGVVALSDGRTLGGHLLRGLVRPTLEVMVTETPAVLRRRHDPATGLALIDLEAGTHGAPAAAHGGSHGQHRS